MLKESKCSIGDGRRSIQVERLAHCHYLTASATPAKRVRATAISETGRKDSVGSSAGEQAYHGYWIARCARRNAGVWLGHDWGALIVWAMASNHPKRCQGIVNMSIPYLARSFALPHLVATVDRKLYPIDQYPVGQ